MIKTLLAVAVLVTVMAIQRVPAQQTDAQMRQQLRGLVGDTNTPPPQTATATNGIFTTVTVSNIKTGAVSFTVSVDTTTNSAGAAIKVLKLTP